MPAATLARLNLCRKYLDVIKLQYARLAALNPALRPRLDIIKANDREDTAIYVRRKLCAIKHVLYGGDTAQKFRSDSTHSCTNSSMATSPTCKGASRNSIQTQAATESSCSRPLNSLQKNEIWPVVCTYCWTRARTLMACTRAIWAASSKKPRNHSFTRALHLES